MKKQTSRNQCLISETKPSAHFLNELLKEIGLFFALETMREQIQQRNSRPESTVSLLWSSGGRVAFNSGQKTQNTR